MIGRSRSLPMPGFSKSEPRTVEQLPPTMMQMAGKETLVIHVQFCGSALIGRNGDDPERTMNGHGAEIALICGKPGELGLMHTMSIEQARSFARSLDILANTVEAAAAQTAEEALKKAAGK